MSEDNEIETPENHMYWFKEFLKAVVDNRAAMISGIDEETNEPITLMGIVTDEGIIPIG